jgi:hypothetical protein
MKVAEHTKQIDGIDYEIAVRDEESGYFGSWFCRKCWKGGVKYDLLPSIDAALAQAENGASLHHEKKHKSS